MRPFTLAVLSTATLTLAACAGSSSDDSTTEDANLPAQYQDLEGLVDAVEDDSLEEASASMMTGTAQLSGAMEISDLGEDGELVALGDLALTADFTGGTVTGTADAFSIYVDATNEVETDLDGSLAINGSITGTSLTATAGGTLSDDEDHIVDMAMDGTFYDYEGDLAVYGDMTGTIDGEAESGGFAAIED